MAKDILIENKSDLTQLNKDQLYYSSKDSEGERLNPYNSLTYALMKSQRNSNIPFGAPDLYDTGDFYRGFFVNISNNGTYKFGSTDSKSSGLMAKYGSNIFGLNSDSKSRFIDEVLFPEIKERIYLITGLTFN